MKKKTETIIVVGSGVVGKAVGKGLLKKGFKVRFVDINPEVIDKLRVEGLDCDDLTDLAAGKIRGDFTIIAVPTPIDGDGGINLGPLKEAALATAVALRRNDNYHVVAIKSTVPPGTTRKVVIPLLQRSSGKEMGVNLGVCANPEYLRETRAERDFLNPRLIIVGESDMQAGTRMSQIYDNFNCPVARVSLEEAEMHKYAHNLLNATKISFFNEMRQLCRKLKINADVVFPLTVLSAEAMWNKRYGIEDKGPFGGMCLPKDTQGFLAWAAEKGLELKLLKAVIGVNKDLIISRNNS